MIVPQALSLGQPPMARSCRASSLRVAGVMAFTCASAWATVFVDSHHTPGGRHGASALAQGVLSGLSQESW